MTRFEWRGVMLDVARHFFGVEEVKRFVDVIARFGFNRLHLHLTDDQGWRMEIESWPRLAEVGGATQVGGGDGGWYSKLGYEAIVEYAAARGVVVVPEIDMPGHVNAALVAYPELAPAGHEAKPYTGVDVGFSSLDLTSERVREFVDEVIGELAELTPGEHIHIGGDEALATPHDEYLEFVEFACGIVRRHGKQPIGWEEIAQAKLEPGTVVQHWKSAEHALAGAKQGAPVIMSPATRTYFDLKYDDTTQLGTEWAGHVSVRDAYEWDPDTQIEGLAASDVLGVEAALWSETMSTMRDVEYMAFPRLLALAEVASTQPSERRWDEFAARLPTLEQELDELGVSYFRRA